MSPWRQVSIGLRRLVRRDAAAQDAADEVRHYLEQSVAEHRARGLSPEAAARAARMEMGSPAGAAEAVRGSGWEQGVAGFLGDLRQAARRLRTEPVTSAVIVLTLALGLGASTAIMSVVGPVLFQPLPYPGANRITAVWDQGADGARIDVTFNTHRELRQRAQAFEALAVFRPWQPTLLGPAEPERLLGQRVSWEYFRVLGVAPAAGRDFAEADDRPGAPGVVILSHELWQRRFGGRAEVVGQPVTLDEVTYQVAGILPAGFENVLQSATELWTPLRYDMGEGRAWGHHLRMIGRLAPGISVVGADQQLDRIATEPVPEFPRVPWAALDRGLLVAPLHADLTREIRPALLAILGAVALILVIACVNVTNLLVARGVRRQPEYALRATLGAGAFRLVRQAVTESLFLAALGGLAGLGVAQLGGRALVALSPPELPRLGAVALDAGTASFGIGLAALIGVLLGWIPARAALQSAGRAMGGASTRHTRTGHRRLRAGLVIAQVALALVLLVCSGLLLRSMGRLLDVPLGLEPAGLMTMQVQATGQRYAEDATADRFFAEALEAVQRVPGVRAAALTSQLPLSGDLDLYGARLDPPLEVDPGEEGGTFRYAVSPGYLELMGIPLRRGRLLEPADRRGTALVAVISESFARRRLPGQDPIGLRLRLGEQGPFTIVGVVGDVRQESLARDHADAVYLMMDQWTNAEPAMSLVVRGAGELAALAPAVRQAVWSVDPGQPVVRQAEMGALVNASAAERRFALVIFQAFALAALVLAATGLYGVLAGMVAERTREIGVRSALGASRAQILALVLGQGMALAGVGVALGLAGALAATTAIGTMLFGVTPLDPPTWAAVTGLLGVVALLACLVPAWRAVRVPPATPLRAE